MNETMKFRVNKNGRRVYSESYYKLSDYFEEYPLGEYEHEQFTGEKARYNDEIYENDLLKDLFEEDSDIYRVAFESGQYILIPKYGIETIKFSRRDLRDFQIIGKAEEESQ
jgi:hypothetical protein